MPSYSNDFETHRPVLSAVVEYLRATRENLYVVEVGCGWGSTPHLLSLLNRFGDRLISLENNTVWLDRVAKSFPTNERHEWRKVGESWYHALRQLSSEIDQIDILFLDSSPWESRTMAMDILSPKSVFTVVHDVDYFPHNRIWGRELSPIQSPHDPGSRDYSSEFRFWIEVFPKVFYAPSGPPTLVGSNSDSGLLELNFDDSTVISRSIS
jgi:hypothetical protein